MNIRNLLPALTALCALAGSPAFAADMPTKAYRPFIPAPIWSGFYAGINGGYGWAKVGDVAAGASSSNLNGWLGGGQIGYNWQAGSFVFGVEGDIQATGQKRSDNFTIGGTAFSVDQKMPWFATARGRIGYAWGPWMAYGTAGVGWVNYKLSVSSGGASVSDNTTKAAFVVGGGLEWMATGNWSAKLEYLYMDTGNTSVTLFGVPFTSRAKDNIVRVGLNYHF